MKLTESFDTFLSDVVNLNQSRIDTLKARVDAIAAALRDFEVYSKILIETRPQGSWAHRTIIKPAGEAGSFDADVVVFVDPYKQWGPADYIDNLYQRFKDHGTYSDKVSRKTRCVTIQYAGEFSIDVVPCIRRTGLLLDSSEWVLNRRDDTEEQTNPDGYTKWFRERDSVAGNNQLIKVVRLMKYLRDVKTTFSAKSVLLTTLLGQQVMWLDDFVGDFVNLPTSLRTLIKRLDGWLQLRPEMPEVTNPSLPSESFTRHWDQDRYSNFRDCIHRYAEWIEDAYLEKDRDESIVKWRRVFGGEFAKSVEIAKSASLVQSTAVEDTSHVALPPWPIMRNGDIVVKATLHKSKNGTFLGTYSSDGRELPSGTWLHFTATHSFHSSVLVKWQVVNTGWAARVARCLRGGFDHSGASAWETTQYRGRHWVECFAVDQKRGVCLARSGRFYVKIA